MRLTCLAVLGLFLLGIERTIGDVKSSLTFVIDDTGSMYDDIQQVKHGANAIFDIVMNSGSSQIEEIVLVTFNDPEGSPGKENKVLVKTTDRDVFKLYLSNIDVDGGDDCPEMSMAGIKLGLQNSREGSSIYVFTDASAKDYQMYDEVEALSQKMGCQIVFVLTGICGDDESPLQSGVYTQLAKATNGQVFHLHRNEIGKILKYVENTVESRKYIIASKTFPAGYGNKFDIPVDGDTKEIVVSVSGQRPKVSVTDSLGAEWPTTYITKLSEVAVVKAEGVKPGVYTVEVGSEGETHVVVSGSTTVHFQHGFSTVLPSDISDTVTRPVPGEESFLSIKLSTEGDGEVRLRSVKILDMDDKIFIEVPLKLINKADQFYTTKQFMPPNSTFKVAITGYDVNSKTMITRISLTPITPQKEITRTVEIKTKAPVVDCVPEVVAHYARPLQLKCKVSGYPKPDVVWESDDKSTVFSHNVLTKEIPYDYVSVLNITDLRKNGTYTCKAVNSIGSSQGSTIVQTRMRYFNVIANPKDTVVEYQMSAKIFCKVDAYPPATILWYKDLRPLRPDENMELSADGSVLSIRSMEPYMANNYICEARNADKRKIYMFKLDISGAEAPVINKENTKVFGLRNSNVDIKCDVTKGIPKPTISWYHKNPEGSYTKLDASTDTIHLYNVSNTGSYICLAENQIGHDENEIDLILEYPPSITRPNEFLLTKDLGEEVTLVCPTVGVPAPRITWKLNGERISRSVRHTIYADGSLRFYATSADEGEYECEAVNEHGTDQIEYKLNIYVPVEIESPVNSFIELMEGSTVTLPCRADGSPKPRITWNYRSNDGGVRPSQFRPSEDTGSLRFNSIQLSQAGEYTCVATNSRGSKNITYEVSVLAPPKIYYKTNRFQGVEGDMQILIPCNATGNPKPGITWSLGGYQIASGSQWFDISAEGNLIVKNIDTSSAGVYICKASNRFRSVQEYFSLTVQEFPDPSNVTKEIKLKKGDSAKIPCFVPRRETDRLLWFKDGHLLSSPDLVLSNVTESDSGTYTCRVSSVDKPAQSGSTRVEVGFEPWFENPGDEKEIIFAYGEIATLDCSAVGFPEPEVKWYHNGREIEFNEYTYDLEMYNDYDKGQYTCVVSNSFGSVQQDFVISSFECLLDVNRDFNGNEPLMLTRNNKFKNFQTNNGYMRIPKNEKIKFVCPTRFNKIHAKEIYVTCDKEQQFVNWPSGKRIYNYSDLKCREKWQPNVYATTQLCANGNGELLYIGFLVRKQFQTVYEVCLDRISKNPIYSKLDMEPTLANAVASNDTHWFDYGKPVDLDGLYDCSYQNARTSAILNKSFHRGDGCCFAKRMLVNPMDLAPGLQSTTYSHLNTVPHWGTCDSIKWQDVERRVRRLVVSADRTLHVYTGTAYNLELPNAFSDPTNLVLSTRGKDVQVPKYLWKVVQDSSRDASVAIIQVNVPDLKLADAYKYLLCKDVCRDVKWMRTGNWRTGERGFTYCCRLPEFERAFNLQGTFPKHMNLLSELYDDHYLHATT